MISFRACNPQMTLKDETTGEEFEMQWCDSHVSYKDPSKSLPGPLHTEIQEGNDPFEDCTGSGSQGDMYPFYYDRRECRDTMTSLGAALGYTAVIETCVTIVIIVAFQKL